MTDEVERTGETYRLIAADYAAAWQDRSVLQRQLDRFVALMAPGSQ